MTIICNSGGDVALLPAKASDRAKVFSTSPASDLLASAPPSFFPATAGAARSQDRDYRVAIHEAAHWIVGRAYGRERGAVTIEQGPNFSGLCWWDGDVELPASYDGEADDGQFVESARKLQDLLPPLGTSRDCLVPLIASVHAELPVTMAGIAGEKLFCGQDCLGASDRVRARADASKICNSDDGIDALVNWGEVEAAGILQKFWGAVIAVAEALIERRTISDPHELDQLIHVGLAKQSLSQSKKQSALMAEMTARVAASAQLFEPLKRQATIS